MITNENFIILKAILAAHRKAKKSEVSTSDLALQEVLQAIEIAGWILVPRGLISALKKVLIDIDNEKKTISNKSRVRDGKHKA